MAISTTPRAATVGASTPYRNQVAKTNGVVTPAAPTGDALTLIGQKKSMATVESQRSHNAAIGAVGLAGVGGLGYLLSATRLFGLNVAARSLFTTPVGLAILGTLAVIGGAMGGILTKKSD